MCLRSNTDKLWGRGFSLEISWTQKSTWIEISNFSFSLSLLFLVKVLNWLAWTLTWISLFGWRNSFVIRKAIIALNSLTLKTISDWNFFSSFFLLPTSITQVLSHQKIHLRPFAHLKEYTTIVLVAQLIAWRLGEF